MRELSKSELFKQIKPHLNYLGISRISSVGEFIDIDVKVVNCVRPAVKTGQISTTQGIAYDLKSAACGAILEAAERHCAASFDPMKVERNKVNTGSSDFLSVKSLGYELENGVDFM